MFSKLRTLWVALLLATGSQFAHATLFNFSQSGFTGGGSISGSFVGTDLDLDGHINSFVGEVSAFSMTFSGDSIVGDFSHGLADFSGVIYAIGSGFIGDDATGGTEGLASNWGGVAGYDYASGLGPTGDFGGRVIDIATGATSSTQNLIAVSAVPEPATLSLVAIAVAGLAGFRRRKP